MDDTLRSVFADNLTVLLNMRGETTVSVARRSHLNQKTVWNYCYSPVCNPTLNNMEAIAGALQVSPYRLLLAESFTHNTVPGAVIERIIESLNKLNEHEAGHVAELVGLLVRQKGNREGINAGSTPK